MIHFIMHDLSSLIELKTCQLNLWSSILLAALVVAASQVIYNVHFHPLARYPGPKLAAASLWWQIWIEVVTGQSLSLKLVELHGKYGDIVRIGPNELHFARTSAYHEIYHQKSRWSKDMKLYHIFARKLSTLTVPDYATAKKRRDITAPLFSRKNVIEMQHLVQRSIDETCTNIHTHIKNGRPLNLLYSFRCCAVDVIFSICFSTPLNASSSPDFQSPFVHAMHSAIPVVPLYKHFPIIQKIMTLCPPSIAVCLKPELKGLVHVHEMVMKQVRELKSNPGALTSYPYRTIYHELLSDKDNVPSDMELRDEAFLFVNAGTDSASDALFHGAIRVIHNSDICATLQKELDTAWPRIKDVPRLEELEKLPYLTAIIKESLRFSHGVVQPMTRVVPEGGAQISGKYIPGGTVVGMSNIFVHWNEGIFPDHLIFKPERWMGPEAEALNEWLVSFSKGPRSCLGINLGWCELYLGFANLFRRYDCRLINITPADVTWRDCYLPWYGGPPVYVDVKQRSEDTATSNLCCQ